MMATPQIQDGQVFEPKPNQPFSIHEPDSVWIVRSGKLDLFLIDAVNGESAGARYPVARIDEGMAVFGMYPSECRTVIAATAISGTELLRLPQSRLRARTLDRKGAADTLALLEDWITRLSDASSSAAVPKLFIDLEPGVTLEVAEDPKPILAAHGILWVQHLSGSSVFLNTSETEPITSFGYFPLSRNGWLQPAPRSRIQSLASADWLKADPQWQGLQAFQKVVLQRLILNRSAIDELDRTRRMKQIESDASIVDDAFHALAFPLRKAGSSPRTETVGLVDPTLRACEAIGQCLGVKIVAPTELRSGGTFKDAVEHIASASSLRYRRVVLKGEWWTTSAGPLLAFRENDHRPLALLPAAQARYQLYDPVEDRCIPLTPDLAVVLDGFAYSFYRSFPNRKLSVWDIVAFGMHGTRRELVSIVTMGICAGLVAMVVPVATGIIVDSIIPSAQRSQLLQISSFLVVVALAGWMFIVTRNFASLRLEGKMGSSLQAAIWDRLLRLPVPFFRAYTSGDLADRSLGIEYIMRALTGSVMSSILSGVFSIFSFLLLFFYSWRLALIATGLVFLTFAASMSAIYVQILYQRRIFLARGRISGMLLEFVDNIAKLRVAGAERRAFAVWAREFSAQKELGMRARFISNGLAIFNAAFPVISLATIVGFATQLMGQPLLHALTTGSFLAFLAAFIQFQSGALQLSSAVESALSVVPVHERATPILDALPEVSEGSKHPGELRGSIEIGHVNFRYHADTPVVLRDVSLSVKPGEFIAIVGPSGSGKSSLFRLLLGFEKPESGAIYYDGQDLSGLDIQAVRQQIGTVMQSARLMSGTIFNNIVGSAPLSLEDAWVAARNSGLDNDIRAMPMGMHTMISEGGGNLSGGQRQRLMIARAIVKKPRIFLFDEATSALDNQTQAVVSHSLEALQSTRIVIAHRLSTIANANRIVVLSKGVVMQAGSYSELASQEGLFRELVKRQLA
jgi:NHLM bacteriocin system ABC transporter ATP-binding protein